MYKHMGVPDVANILWLVHYTNNVGVPEWSNGRGLGPRGLSLPRFES